MKLNRETRTLLYVFLKAFGIIILSAVLAGLIGILIVAISGVEERERLEREKLKLEIEILKIEVNEKVR